MSCCIAHAILPADRCRSFARYLCKSLRILALSITCFSFLLSLFLAMHTETSTIIAQRLTMPCPSCRSPRKFLRRQFQRHCILVSPHQLRPPFLPPFYHQRLLPFWPPASAFGPASCKLPEFQFFHVRGRFRRHFCSAGSSK